MNIDLEKVRDKTIADFGEQWTLYRDNDGFYGSQALFHDIIGPLLPADAIAGKQVADIGSGTGRIVSMLLKSGASHVTAVEPSAAFDVLVENLRDLRSHVTFIRGTGEQLPPTCELDFVFCIGVLHHVPDPNGIVRAAWSALRPGGRLLVWLYGKEGNQAYLLFLNALRRLSRAAPHGLIAGFAWLLSFPLFLYMLLCRWIPLPLRDYMTEVMSKMTSEKRRLVIYDQLKPAYAKYYTRNEAVALLADNGFSQVTAYHRHGYSWTVMGIKDRT